MLFCQQCLQGRKFSAAVSVLCQYATTISNRAPFVSQAATVSFELTYLQSRRLTLSAMLAGFFNKASDHIQGALTGDMDPVSKVTHFGGSCQSW